MYECRRDGCAYGVAGYGLEQCAVVGLVLAEPVEGAADLAGYDKDRYIDSVAGKTCLEYTGPMCLNGVATRVVPEGTGDYSLRVRADQERHQRQKQRGEHDALVLSPLATSARYISFL